MPVARTANNRFTAGRGFLVSSFSPVPVSSNGKDVESLVLLNERLISSHRRACYYVANFLISSKP